MSSALASLDVSATEACCSSTAFRKVPYGPVESRGGHYSAGGTRSRAISGFLTIFFAARNSAHKDRYSAAYKADRPYTKSEHLQNLARLAELQPRAAGKQLARIAMAEVAEEIRTDPAAGEELGVHLGIVEA
jgi:hypothetical protein